MPQKPEKMKNNNDVLDIIYAGRNKAYGGYELRHVYPQHVTRAIIYGSLLLLLLFLIPFVSQVLNKGEIMPPPVPFDPIELSPDIFLFPSEPIAPERTQTVTSPVRDVTPVVTPDKNVPADLPPLVVNQGTDAGTGTIDAPGVAGGSSVADAGLAIPAPVAVAVPAAVKVCPLQV